MLEQCSPNVAQKWLPVVPYADKQDAKALEQRSQNGCAMRFSV
jgi:hypothetical protein